MKQLSKVFPEPLIAFATAVYMALGMPEADAALAADTLVQADLWGHQSHGVLRLSWYAARLKAGVCSAVARPDIIIDAGALAVIDEAIFERDAANGASELICISPVRRLENDALEASEAVCLLTGFFSVTFCAFEPTVSIVISRPDLAD